MKNTLFTLGLCALASSTISASVITYENRKTDAGVDTSNYASSWGNQSSIIKSRDLNEFTNLRASGSNRDQHSHLSLSFDVSNGKAGQDWWFQFSPDAGLGGEIYFDGNLVERDTSNLWWGGQWSRSSELLDAVLADVGAGNHTLDMYWAENCCNGGQSGRFSVDNGTSWLAVSSDNLNAVGVSEPGSLALLALGVAGLAAARRIKK